MAKVDFKKEMKELYNPPKNKVTEVDVPEMNFLKVDGTGNPNDNPQFVEAIEALYGMAYTLKFQLRKAGIGDEFVVPPLQGLWWADDMSAFIMDSKEEWKWTLMIMQPDWVTPEHVEEARELLKKKKDPPALPRLRYEKYHEGMAAQIMHLGPYSEERPSIEKIHSYIEESGRKRRGLHHEIYLSDPNKGDPAKAKTVIRQPME